MAEETAGRGKPAKRRMADELAAMRAELDETRRLLVETEQEARELRAELARVNSSATGRMLGRLQAGARRAAPLGTRRQERLHTVAQSAAVLMEQGPRGLMHQLRRHRSDRAKIGAFPDTPEGRRAQYLAWLRTHDPDAAALSLRRAAQTSWTLAPVVSVIMPVHDPDPAWLEGAIASVRGQIYERWELCIADDGSQREDVRELLQRSAATEPRIKLTVRDAAGGIAAATNSALGLATGAYVAFLDHDDVLRAHALHAMVAYLQERPEVEVIYSDEDKILLDGRHGDPMFKPDYSPEMLLSWNYVTHFVMVRKDLVDDLGGLRLNFDGSQDHDLLLRAVERAHHVGHVPEVLYAWRMIPGSAALSSDYKPLAREAGRRAVEDAVARRGLQAKVDFGAGPGLYDVRYVIAGRPRVTIVIPTRDRVSLLRACLGSVERHLGYENCDIVIVNNGSRDAEAIAYLRASPHRVLDVDRPFNFSALVNAAAAVTDAEHLLLLNNDVIVRSAGWLEAMLGHSQHGEVGAVGARLLYSDGTPQHEGVVVGGLHVAANVNMGWPVVREVSAVTGACLMTRREVFEKLGGFDETLAEAFNDVDYCLRARLAGYSVIYTPRAELVHREGGTRGRRTPEGDRERFVARWGDESTLRDPYLDVNVLWPNPLRLRF